MNMPVFYKMKQDIENLKNYSYPNIVINSAHDSTLIRLLKAMGMFDYKLIIFGELITFEIYTAKNNDNNDNNNNNLKYYFRFTRKGEFIPYPYCDYNNTFNTSTELCDLDIFYKNSLNGIVSQTEWSKTLCANLTSDCRCGYCKKDSITSTLIPLNTNINCPNGAIKKQLYNELSSQQIV